MYNNIPTIYHDLNEVLTEMTLSLQSILAETFIGFYLQGSFAVGDFDEYSDVDFIVAVREDLTSEQVDALQIMHKRIFGLPSYWAQHLEGSYCPLSILKDYRQSGSELWYMDNGSDYIIRSAHCNTLLVRCILKEKGVVICGPLPETLINPIPVEALQQEMFAVIHNWGKQILENPEQYNNCFYQGFIVLSYCRMLHDFIYGSPGSKRQGAEWAKKNLDPQWQGLIDRTWACRPIPEKQVRQPADEADFAATLQFIRYVMQESKKY